MQTQNFFPQIIVQGGNFFFFGETIAMHHEFEIRIEELIISIDFILFVGFEIMEQILSYIVVSKPNTDYE